MKIIISPAKKMKMSELDIPHQGYPLFVEEGKKDGASLSPKDRIQTGKTAQLLQYLQSLSLSERKELWACNEDLARENSERIEKMDLKRNCSPAILSYEGIQYQYMAPSVMEVSQLAYLQSHLRILSGFYGVVKPLDGVVPYRLEMQAKAKIGSCKNLYEFWGKDIWEALLLEELEDRLQKEGENSLGNKNPMLILNLASKEYAKCIEKYLPKDRILRKKIMWKDELKELSFPIHYISCGFYEKSGEKLVQKGVYAKMARGEMVRFLAENKIENAEEIKGFKGLDFNFEDKLSTEDQYIFLPKGMGRFFCCAPSGARF